MLECYHDVALVVKPSIGMYSLTVISVRSEETESKISLQCIKLVAVDNKNQE